MQFASLGMNFGGMWMKQDFFNFFLINSEKHMELVFFFHGQFRCMDEIRK